MKIQEIQTQIESLEATRETIRPELEEAKRAETAALDAFIENASTMHRNDLNAARVALQSLEMARDEITQRISHFGAKLKAAREESDHEKAVAEIEERAAQWKTKREAARVATGELAAALAKAPELWALLDGLGIEGQRIVNDADAQGIRARHIAPLSEIRQAHPTAIFREAREAVEEEDYRRVMDRIFEVEVERANEKWAAPFRERQDAIIAANGGFRGASALTATGPQTSGFYRPTPAAMKQRATTVEGA
jgi:DNA repair exonuclease SbcCD ATPase subunit